MCPQHHYILYLLSKGLSYQDIVSRAGQRLQAPKAEILKMLKDVNEEWAQWEVFDKARISFSPKKTQEPWKAAKKRFVSWRRGETGQLIQSRVRLVTFEKLLRKSSRRGRSR